MNGFTKNPEPGHCETMDGDRGRAHWAVTFASTTFATTVYSYQLRQTLLYHYIETATQRNLKLTKVPPNDPCEASFGYSALCFRRLRTAAAELNTYSFRIGFSNRRDNAGSRNLSICR